MPNILSYCFKRCPLFSWQPLKWHLLSARHFFLSASQILIHVIFTTTPGGSVADTIAPLMNPWSTPIAPAAWVGWQWGPLVDSKHPGFPSYTVPPLLSEMSHSLMPFMSFSPLFNLPLLLHLCFLGSPLNKLPTLTSFSQSLLWDGPKLQH